MDFSISPLLDFQGISAQLGLFFLFLSVALHCGEKLCFALLGFVRHVMLCYAILGQLRFAIRAASDGIAMVCYVLASHSSPPLSRSLHPTLAPPSHPLSPSPVLARPPPRRRACTWVHTCARVCTYTGLGMLAGVRASSSTRVHACARTPTSLNTRR